MAVRTLTVLAKSSLLISLLGLCACSRPDSVLETRHTTLTLRAGSTAPQLIRIAPHMAPSAVPAWSNTTSEPLIEFVWQADRKRATHWKFKSGRSTEHRVSFVYENEAPKLRLEWEWAVPELQGPIEHSIRIQNLDNTEVWLPLQNSFAFRIPTNPASLPQHFYVEKGAGSPSNLGTHLDSIPIGYRIKNDSSTYAHPNAHQPREVIPFLAVLDRGHGWYAGLEFSGRTSLALNRNRTDIEGTIGLNPDPAGFRTRLKPQQTFETPRIFLGAFTGDLDVLGNTLRPWVRHVLGNPHAWANPHYPLLVNNSWGSGMQVNESVARRMLRDSAELGVEMFHLDAGWFRGVGDWYPDPHKFPQGLAALADAAHQLGLQFGLWVDWTQAGLDTSLGALNLLDPKVHSWTVADVPAGWKPQPFKGQTIDIAEPAARDYAQREVLRIIGDYHLDMLEHDGYLAAQGCIRSDHPHAPPDPASLSVTQEDGSALVLGSNSTDVSYHATRAYYEIYAAARRRYPNLLLEICNDGGRMVDFGSAAHGDYFSITDAYDPVSNRRAFFDASHLLPAAMLEGYVEKWPVPRIENFLYMLRSGMQGWLTIMQDTNAWTPEQHAAAKEEIGLYKTRLRPLIRDANLYHVAPRPDGIAWDGTEFFAPATRSGVLYAFRGATSQPEHRYQLRGLVPHHSYRLHFHDGSAPDRTAPAEELQTLGLLVSRPVPNSSELVFIDEVMR